MEEMAIPSLFAIENMIFLQILKIGGLETQPIEMYSLWQE